MYTALKNIVLLTTGIAMGLIAASLFLTKKNRDGPPSATGTAEGLKAMTETIIHTIDVQQDKLEKKNQLLSATLLHTTEKLKGASGELRRLQTQVATLHISSNRYDSSTYLQQCDTLYQTAESLRLASIQQDSLCMEQAILFQEKITNQDAVLLLEKEKNTMALASLQLSLAQQEQLETVIKKLQQQHRKQKWRSKLKNIGLLVLTAFSVNKMQR